jgi:hypothetical protein
MKHCPIGYLVPEKSAAQRVEDEDGASLEDGLSCRVGVNSAPYQPMRKTIRRNDSEEGYGDNYL